jgi:hypothetical protein
MAQHQSINVGVVTGLWTVSFALGVIGTVVDDVRLMFWAMMAGLVATVATGWMEAVCATRHERLRIEHVIEGLVAQAREGARQQAASDLPRVH